MKQKLLFLLVSLLTSVAAMAQWVKPVPQSVDTWQYSSEGDTTVYYLYNKGAGAFFTEGNDWGTRASIGSTGLKVAISKYVPKDGEWDGKTVFFNDWSIAKQAWKQVFIDNENAAYVDHNGQANYWWEIEAQGSGLYRIKGADINPQYNSATYGQTSGAFFGVSYATDENTTIISPLIDIAEDNTAHVDWCFVTPEAYEAYLPKQEVYEAAVALGAKIEEAKGYALNTTDAEAVYGNTSSTKDQLVAATDAVQEAINAYKESAASPENPQDLTDVYIPDGDFEKNQGPGVWKRDQTPSAQNFQTNGTPNKLGDSTFFLEAWHGSAFKGKIYVPITGLPNGVYQFTLSAATNGGNSSYVYAGNDSIEVTSSNMTPYTVFTRVENGELEVGFNMPQALQNWVGIDDAKLLYLGNSVDSYVYWLSETMKNAPEYTENDDVQKAALEEYDKILGTDLSAFKTMDDVLAFIPLFDEAVKTIQANAEAYAAFRALLDDVEELQLAGYQGDEAEALYDYVSDEADDIMRAKTLSTEEMEAETTKLSEMIELVRKNCLVPGMDCTKNLVNPNFDKRVEGWSWDTTMGEPAWGGLDKNPCVERYEQDFNFYQTVTGIPNGVYEVRAQAFYRSGGATADIYAQYLEDPTLDEIITYLYANKSAVPVKSIASQTYTENLADNCTEAGTAGPGLWLVGGMNSSSEAFLRKSDGVNLDYDNVVMGVVTDGTLTVGIKCIGGTKSGRWPLWDNFRLTYVGMEKSAIKDLIADYADEIEELKEQSLSSEAMSAVLNAFSAGESADTGEDAFAALSALIDALADAQESVAIYTALEDAVNTLAELVDTYSDSPVAGDAATLCNTVAAGVSDMTYTTDEAVTQLAAVLDMSARIRVPSTEGASEDNPIDFTQVILNNGFETGDLSNWLNEGTIKAQAQNNTSFDNKQGDYYCERWHVTGTVNINQTVLYLPAGKYEISAYAYSEAEDCVLFANGQEVSVSTSGLYTVPAVVDGTGLLTFGVKWTDDGSKWTCMDEFTMKYVGVPTAIENINAPAISKVNGKFFKNGQVFIMKNGVKYNVAGQKMK